MPFSRPTLAELIARAQADAESRLSSGPLLPVSNVAVLSRVQAGAVHGLYGYLDWLSLQIFPDTAEAEHLARCADVWGIDRLAATFAVGNVDFAGTSGASVPAGTRLRRADGAEYLTDADATLVAGAATAAVTAVVAGDSGDCAAGTALTLTSAISGVQSTAIVASGGLVGGADTEGDEALRARLLERIRQPPHGGADFDYIAWALAAHPDVTRVWVFPLELGAGTVTVRLMTDGATVDGIPDAAVITAVQIAIDADRPVTAAVTVVAPLAAPLAFSLTVVPDTIAVRAAVEAALADLILREAEPGGTLLLSHIREAISGATGETDYTLTSPAADVTAAVGAITTLGTVTWL